MSSITTLFTGPPKPKRRDITAGPSAEEIQRQADEKSEKKAELARLRTSKSRKGSRRSSILNTASGVQGEAPVLKKTLG